MGKTHVMDYSKLKQIEHEWAIYSGVLKKLLSGRDVNEFPRENMSFFIASLRNNSAPSFSKHTKSFKNFIFMKNIIPHNLHLQYSLFYTKNKNRK